MRAGRTWHLTGVSGKLLLEMDDTGSFNPHCLARPGACCALGWGIFVQTDGLVFRVTAHQSTETPQP